MSVAMQSYSHTQKQSLGIYFVCLLSLLIIIFLGAAFFVNHLGSVNALLSGTGLLPLLLGSVLVACCVWQMVAMSSLTVSIDDRAVIWHGGLDAFHTEILLSDIASADLSREPQA